MGGTAIASASKQPSLLTRADDWHGLRRRRSPRNCYVQMLTSMIEGILALSYVRYLDICRITP
jgi:hypothetical protein